MNVYNWKLLCILCYNNSKDNSHMVRKCHTCNSMNRSKDNMRNYKGCTMLNTRMDQHNNNCNRTDRNNRNQSQYLIWDCTIPNNFCSHSNIRGGYYNMPDHHSSCRYRSHHNILLSRFQIRSSDHCYYRYMYNFYPGHCYRLMQPACNNHL